MKNQTKLQQVLLPKVISVISIALLVILWEVSTSLKWVNPIFLPAPQSVFSTFMELLMDGYKGASLTTHISASLYRLFTSLVIAFLTAVPLGIMCGYSKYVLAIFDPIIEFYRPLPPLAYYALLVLWMGIDDRSKVALLYLSAFAPLFLATVSGVKKVPQDRIHAAYTLGASKWKMLYHIMLPSALPDIVTGLRTAIGVTYATLVAAEMVAATSGLGWMVLDASKYLRSDIVFVGIFIMAGIAILMDGLIRWFQHAKFSWVGK